MRFRQHGQQLLALIAHRHGMELGDKGCTQLFYDPMEVEHGRKLQHHQLTFGEQGFEQLEHVGLTVADSKGAPAIAIATRGVEEEEAG